MPAGHSLALELHFVCSRLLIVEPVQQIVAWYKPTHHKPKIKTPLRVFEFLVGAAGFEPTLTESESGVLPLNYAPMRDVLYASYFHFAIKIFQYY